MKSKLLCSAFAVGLIFSACSREDASSRLKDQTSGEDDFEMGNSEDDEFGMGGDDPQASCELIEPGTDSLVGEFVRTQISRTDAESFPEVPFAFIADANYSVPAYARAVQAAFMDPISKDDPTQTRSLYLTPNVRNIMKVQKDQVFIFGTEKRWLEINADITSNNMIVKEYVKGSEAAVSTRILSGDREFIATALNGQQNLFQSVYVEKQIFLVERLGVDTFAFEFRFKGAGKKYECYALLDTFAGSEPEKIYGFGFTEGEARTDLRSTCGNVAMVPGFESLNCDIAVINTYCSERKNIEFLTDEVVRKTAYAPDCLAASIGGSGKYLVADHEDAQSPTTYKDAISKVPTNIDAFFVAKAAVNDPITVDQIGALARKDFRTYTADGNYKEYPLKDDESFYIGYQGVIGNVSSYLEIKKQGTNYIVKQYSFGGLVSTTSVAAGTEQSGQIMLYGSAAAINFMYTVGDNGTNRYVAVTASKVQF